MEPFDLELPRKEPEAVPDTFNPDTLDRGLGEVTKVGKGVHYGITASYNAFV